ncbi:Flp family type IVb pilin [Helcococcus ovis]|uniref:Flp family type IVb pilin n=1 Tax=Helcococcus ovis TaxID=72026 RepID=UPI0038B85281
MWRNRQGWKILALISVVVIALLTQIGGKLQETFKSIIGELTKANGQEPKVD